MSGACAAAAERASEGVASALRAVDCLSGETVATAFARLFGREGALLPALTLGLTLYIAIFAIGLLTGRARLGVSALTPRALMLGLVLTFATSWAAYSQVVWTLATGAPDEVASALTGSRGPATQIFGDKVDLVFAAIAEAAEGAQAPGQAGAAEQAAQGTQAAGQAAQGNFTPANLMWLAALLLLLGTVGVLVTARIALALLLALGPVFVVLALFGGTRGLFVGWLRATVLAAVTPLFVVVGGGLVLELLVPVVASLRGAEGVDGRGALALFVIACVHVALMAMAVRLAGTVVSAWGVFGLARERGEGGRAPAPAVSSPAPVSMLPPPAPGALAGSRARMIVPAAGAGLAASAEADGFAPGASRTQVTRIVGGALGEGTPGLPALPRARARGIGSRFAAPVPRGPTLSAQGKTR